jgi:hypothetical protein
VRLIDGLAVGFPEFDSQRLQCEHRPVGEPADSGGGGGFVWVLDNTFSVRDRFSGAETEFGYHSNPSLRFLQR